MTDTTIPVTDTPSISSPPSRSERVKAFIGDLARPFAIYVTSAAAAVGIIRVAWVVENGNDGAIYLGAVAVLVGGIYGFKTWENAKTSKHAAEIEVAKTTTEPKP